MAKREKGLPANVDAERFVLGSILLNGELFVETAAALEADDFSLEKHRRIWRRMAALQERGAHIDRVTLADELMNTGELESVDGLSYLVSLDDGMPQIPNISAYVKIVKEKSRLRRIVFAAEHMQNRALMGEETSQDILSGIGETLLALGPSDEGKGPQTAEEIVTSLPGGVSEFLGPQKQGIATGFRKYDEMTGGLHPGEVTIYAARPSMGKTALGTSIAAHVAVNLHLSVAMFSLEMSKEQMLHRLVCATARVNSHHVRANYTDAEERKRLADALSRVCDSGLRIDDRTALRSRDLHATLRRLKNRGKLDLAIVDYLQLMTTGGRSENRNQEVTQISRGIKTLAMELGVPLVVLSQLNRAVEARRGNNRPQLSDLRESGALEQDADNVAFIFREEMYARDREDLRGVAELILAKQRNGPIGTVPLVFLHSFTKFENRAQDVGDEPSPFAFAFGGVSA